MIAHDTIPHIEREPVASLISARYYK